MGFFDLEEARAKRASKGPQNKTGLSLELMHKKECSVCPLNNASVRHPKMKPHGSKSPLIYMLNDAPTEEDDRRGRHFSGKGGTFLRDQIPRRLEEHIRWNACIRTQPPGRDPSFIEIECCRPSIIRDIEETRPRAIFGFGALPLQWALNQTGIARWSGRRVPVKIGGHTCWFFPMMHPDVVLAARRWEPRHPNEYGSENEFAFVLQMRQALDAVEDLPEPFVHDVEYATEGLEIITGARGMRDLERVEELLDIAAQESLIGFDYETSCLRPYSKGAKLLSVGMATREHAFAFALRHRESEWGPGHLKKIERMLEDFLYDAPCKRVAHHLDFELEWSAFFFGKDVIRAQQWEDSEAQAYLIDERPGTLSLEFLGMQHFGINLKEINNLDRKRLDDEPLEDVLLYNALDARYHRRLFLKQRPLIKEQGLTWQYEHAVRRVETAVLTQMAGVPVSKTRVKELHDDLAAQQEKVEKELMALPSVKKFARVMGREFRPTSTHDVTAMLRRVLELNVENTQASILTEIKDPFGKKLIELRKITKQLSTYIEPICPGGANLHPDGMMHPTLNTKLVRTWRTSSEDPNIQNWPKRGPNKIVREQVAAPPGHKIVSIDWAGIQARNVAMESKDKTLVKYFWEKYDIHGDWLERTLRVCPSYPDEGAKAVAKDKELFKAYRNIIKNKFVFPSFFGARPKSIATSLHIPQNKAEALQEEFWDEFPSIHAWHKRLKKFYLEHGYVTGLSGHRRHAPIEMNQLINAPIQADESVITMGAMIALSEIDYEKYQANLMVHDDLTFIWPAKEVEKRAEVVIREMIKKRYKWINVPLGAEMSIGDDWNNLKDVGEFYTNEFDGRVSLSDKVLERSDDSFDEDDDEAWDEAA